MRKLWKKVLSSVLCLAMLLSFLSFGAVNAFGVSASIDYGKNPTPQVDIAVSIPADYPGTFDDFKAELTAALIAQGMDPSSFRITDTAVKIDTTNLDGWYVYDHYYNANAYNALKLSAEQQKKQPYRAADNTCMTSHGKSGVPTPCLIQDVFVAKRWGTPGTKLYPFNQHTYSWEENGRANMMFAGYGTKALTDYMFYPATSDSRRTIEFDLDCGAIDTHTLIGAGFLLNAAITNGSLNGYSFFINWSSNKIELRKIQNAAATIESVPGTVVTSIAMPSMATGTKLRIKVVLNRDSVTVTSRKYTGNQMGAEETWFNNYSIPILAAAGNGFGPIVSYSSHGCASMTYFQFGDLAMTYDATAFDALKEVQYVQSAPQKYFINIAGEKGTGIPDPEKDSQGYIDGITRMDENEIFYISNKDDGRVGTDNDGIGADNTYITSTESDFISELAGQIAKNYEDKKEFTHVNPADRTDPLSDFYIINTTKDSNGQIDGSQLLTVHQRHLINNSSSLQVSIYDKSKLGNTEAAGTKFTKYEVTLLDPDGNPVTGLNRVTITPDAEGNVTFPEYTVDKNSKPGRYTFQMEVTDDKGNRSGITSTYFTVFDDDVEPIAVGKNTTKNHATITLTDTGQGIDDDGITFLKDNRGSGVYAYYITDEESKNDSPLENPDLWIYLDEPIHEYSFDVDLTNYTGAGKKLVVYYMDECRNAGNIAVFKPVHVVVEDPEGNPIDDYYIIGETPVIVLPDDVPKHPDPDFGFSNWEIVPPGDNPPGGGDPITEGKEIPVDPDDDEPTITIRPSYTDHKVNLTYNANAADAYIEDAEDEDGNPSATTSVQITENSDLAAKIRAQGVVPVREGYNFVGWYLDAACTTAVKDQIAATDTIVYAKWEIASYDLHFDHNGGGSSGIRVKSDVTYGTPLSEINNPNSPLNVKANENPERPGYNFKEWTLDKEGNQPIGSATMPASDYTLYAQWTIDTSKFVVSFDTKGGNIIADKPYASTDKAYGNLQKPTKSGYVFEGWYVEYPGADGETVKEKVELSGSTMPAYYTNKTPTPDKGHTLTAEWSPATDTRVNVAFYLNSGVRDENGNYRYVRANNLTQSFLATTEDTVSVPQEILDKYNELLASSDEYAVSRDYWLNDEIHPEERTGVVTGGTPLELKLYYDRFFNVNGVVLSGEETGTVSSVIRVKEGERPTITWAPAEGYHTANIILDNRIRDGLLAKNEYTFEEDIHKDYYFRVRFDAGEAPVNPAAKDYYSVVTKIEGCYDGTCSITPSGRYVAGRDSILIDWNIPENYSIVSIQMDQTIYLPNEEAVEAYKEKYPDINPNYIQAGPQYFNGEFIRFRKIAQDHQVIVNVEKLPTLGGGSTQGNYTVTVNTYGGDGKYTVSPSQVSAAGENVQVKWAQGSSVYNVASVYIDGVNKSADFKDLNNGSTTFSKIDANHVVDIYLTKEDAPTENPTYDKDSFNKLNTQIVGGPGTITGGGYIGEDNKNQTITWDINTVTDPTDPKYSYYEVESVTINGEEVSVDEYESGSLNREITEDTEVVVNIKPVLYNVNVYRYGFGKTTESKTYYKAQSYVDLSGEEISGNGYTLVKVVVDGVIYYDFFNPVTDEPETASFFSMLREAISPRADGDDVITVKDDNTASKFALDISNLNRDHDVEYYFTPNNPETGDPTPAPAVTHKVTADITNVAGAEIKGQGIVEDNGNATVSWDVPEGYEVEFVTVDGKVMAVEGNSVSLTDITSDKHVVVNLSKTDDNTTDVPVKGDVDTQFTVDTGVVGGKGEITPSAKYNEGGSATITWKVVPVVTATGSIFDKPEYKEYHDSLADEFDAATGVIKHGRLDYDVDGDGVPDLNIDIDGDGYPELNIDLNGDNVADYNIDNGSGKPDTTKPLIHDDNKIKETRDFEVKYIIVDGKVRNDLISAGSITFDDLDDNHSVVVVVDEKEKTPTNVDTDGDGTPDINIDTDGDGEPDTDIDIDGDGEPDINIDDDGDGIPDREIDEDKPGDPGYGKVDTYLTVRYINELTGEEIPGTPSIYREKKDKGDEYTTDQLLLDEYDFVEVIGIPSGKMIYEDTQITYVYTPKAAVVNVEFVDEDGNAIEGLDTAVINGKVFEDYSLEAAEALQNALDSGKLDGWKLVASENAEGTMTADPITVTYTFAPKDSKIIVNFVDEDGNPIPGKEVVTIDKEYFETYEVEPDNDIYGYELDMDKYPENATGTIDDEEIVVTFVYKLKDASVNVIYKDAETGEVLDTDTKAGKVFDKYSTDAKSIYGYELQNTPSNAEGKLGEENADVVYLYSRKATSVIIKYIDRDGNELAQSITIDGRVFDEFKTKHHDIEGYDWVDVQIEGLKTRAAQNLNDFDGQMQENTITVTYIYEAKEFKVTVQYFDLAGNKLADDKVTTYKYNSEYEVNAAEIDGYKVSRVIGTASGIVKGDVIVTYFYTDDSNEPVDPKPPVDPDDPDDPKPPVDPDEPVDPKPPVDPDDPDDPKPPVDPEKPGINIDTDGDGEPDINIDTDGDGEPDINIDTDGDGEPDINIDTDGDGTPDINIDTDGDREPDINIDTDGDGKADINIDTDNDGKADINIDTDNDGKADINIDTDNDGKADINIDTDNDGKADINIDTDGDGKADANIDADGDGIADTNIIGAETPVDTGSADMFAMYAYVAAAIASVLLVLLLIKKSKKEDEAEA